MTAEEILKKHDPEFTFQPKLIYKAMEQYSNAKLNKAIEEIESYDESGQIIPKFVVRIIKKQLT